MNEKFEIVSMNRANGSWTVEFKGPQSWCGYSPPTVSFSDEDEFLKPVTPQEAAKLAHTELANRIVTMLKIAVISIPDANWDEISRTVLWPQLRSAFDDEHGRDDA